MEKIEKLAKEIYNEVIEEDVVLYREMFDNMSSEPSTSQYSKDINTIYGNLCDKEKDAFLRIIKITSIDTISALLRIIDGYSNIDYDGIEPKLFLGGQDTDGDLQDLFLEYVEDVISEYAKEMEEQNKK